VNEFLILFLLLVLSGVFSGSETALVALSLARAEGLLREGRHGARALYELKHDPSRMLITILIGNNVVNIAASAIATVIATERLGSIGPGIAVGALTVLILVFGEITPKSLATRYSERISLAIAPPMLGFMRLIYPLVWTFQQLTNYVQKRTGAHRDPTVTESELISMVEHGEAEGTIEADERAMIERVFSFNDLQAEDVMTPRYQVFALNGDQPIVGALPEIMGRTYTRIPIYTSDPNDITGVVYLRDLFEAVVEGAQHQPLESISRKPLFVPTTQPIDELITLLRRRKQHLAIAVDEHGSMLGVVTLEDLLEELVGEIYDESDELPKEVKELQPGRIVVEGSAELRVVEQYFGRDLPGKPTDTVSRWLLRHLGRIPEGEERFVFDGLDVFVQLVTGSRVEQVVLENSKETGVPKLSHDENTAEGASQS
jgi:CBS domain containing-hemolysin-like protein